MFRQGLQEFRVCTDYFVDFFGGLQLLYNMVLEQLAFVGVEFLYFTVSSSIETRISEIGRSGCVVMPSRTSTKLKSRRSIVPT
jgi:hypothetical protein